MRRNEESLPVYDLEKLEPDFAFGHREQIITSFVYEDKLVMVFILFVYR